MGTWLSSIHVQSSDRDHVRRIAEAVAKAHEARFLLGPVKRGWIALLSDVGKHCTQAGEEIARQTGAPTFELFVADDDDFRYEFYREGRTVDRYCAAPEGADDISSSDRDSWRGNPEHYADLLGSPEKVEACTNLLHKSHRHFVFESERLDRFAKLLGLSHAMEGYQEPPLDFPGGKQFVHVPDDSDAKSAERQRKADIRAEFKRLEHEGVLRAEIVGPGKAAERQRLQGSWFFDPRDSAFIIQWSHWNTTPGQAFRYSAPAYERHDAVPETSAWTSIYRIAASPSGRWVAIGHASGDWSATLSSWPPGGSLARIPHARDVANVCFDRAERLLLSAGSEDLVLSSVPDGREQARTHLDGAPPAVTLHPDGQWIVLGSQAGELAIRSVENIAQEKRLSTRRGAVAESGDPLAHVRLAMEKMLSGMTGELLDAWLMKNANPERFSRLLFSPDGEWLFAATNLGLRVFSWRELVAATEWDPLESTCRHASLSIL